MDFLQAIFLGIVQGLTEFLPVSSSGHLALFQKIFGFTEAPIFFDTMIHGATLIAVVFYLRKDLMDILRNLKNPSGLKGRPSGQAKKIIWLLFVATLPAVFVGLFFKGAIEESFNSAVWLAIGFFITAIMIFATNLFSDKKNSVSGNESLEKIGYKKSIFIGIFQAISIFSSISRSGATISSAIFLGIDRKSALKFSFLLSIPAILGAIVLQLSDINNVSNSEIYYSLVAFTPAMLAGFWSLKFLDKYMANNKFSLFGYYCIFVGIISLFLI